jgi:release factor glutamine methyltransferase
MEKRTIKNIKKYIRQSLSKIYPEKEISSLISIILEKVNLTKTDILLNDDRILDDQSIDEIHNIVDQLKNFKPIQYILGESEFYDITLEVNPFVLIPRQETEELVNWIINEYTNCKPKILDVGTGSGCIAIALAKNLPAAEVHAIDYHESILELVKKNAQKNNVEVFCFVGDILKETINSEKYDIVVSNPPYVLESEKQQMTKNVLNYEPREALFVDDSDPLLYYRSIGKFALENLKAGGSLYFEINESMGADIKKLVEKYGFRDVLIKKDINGKDRMIKGIKP